MPAKEEEEQSSIEILGKTLELLNEEIEDEIQLVEGGFDLIRGARLKLADGFSAYKHRAREISKEYS